MDEVIKVKEIKTKICSKCGIEKSLDEFYIQSNTIDKHKGICKECCNARAKQYRKDHDTELKQKSKIFRSENSVLIKQQKHDQHIKYKEKDNLRSKIYSETHKEEINERERKYQKDRRENDLQFKVSQNLRSRLRRAIKINQKFGSAINDLGCSIEYFIDWISWQFQNNENTETDEIMTWENYGIKGWHLDHCIPLDYFDLTDRDQFLIANHYTNIRPLWAKENYSKGNKVII
jgi:hypothetical protein